MEVPEVFQFPFQPYSIQLDFMKNLYKCIENRKLGIFESPTGTVCIYSKSFAHTLVLSFYAI